MTGEDERLRIVTINTGKCDGPYRRRMTLLLAGLGLLDADVILMQEAFETANGDEEGLSTPRFLASGLGMDLAAFRLRRKQRVVEGVGVDSYSGLATLSRRPITEVSPRVLPDDPDDGDRGVLFASVETPLGTIRTANTHLTHLRHRDDLRVQQIQEVLDDPWWDGAARVRILGGDLNARPDHEVHTVLRGARDKSGWVGLDVFEVAGEPVPAPTIRREVAGRLVEARLDYLYLLRSPREERASNVIGARVVLDQALDGVLPSDHFGVLADVSLA